MNLKKKKDLSSFCFCCCFFTLNLWRYKCGHAHTHTDTHEHTQILSYFSLFFSSFSFSLFTACRVRSFSRLKDTVITIGMLLRSLLALRHCT